MSGILVHFLKTYTAVTNKVQLLQMWTLPSGSVPLRGSKEYIILYKYRSYQSTLSLFLNRGVIQIFRGNQRNEDLRLTQIQDVVVYKARVCSWAWRFHVWCHCAFRVTLVCVCLVTLGVQSLFGQPLGVWQLWWNNALHKHTCKPLVTTGEKVTHQQPRTGEERIPVSGLVLPCHVGIQQAPRMQIHASYKQNKKLKQRGQYISEQQTF